VLSVLVGVILLGVGLLRLGWIVEFVSYVPISAFVTAASITIMTTQFSTALGIPGINTRDPPYRVIVNTLEGMPNTQVDAVIGISSIAILSLIRFVCTKLEARQPKRKRIWAIVSSLRMSFTILLYTLISWLVNRNNLQGRKSVFRIVGTIERG